MGSSLATIRCVESLKCPHVPCAPLFVPHGRRQQIAVRGSVPVHMATQYLANQRREFVVALLRGERLEISQERGTKAKLDLVSAFFSLELLSGHGRDLMYLSNRPMLWRTERNEVPPVVRMGQNYAVAGDAADLLRPPHFSECSASNLSAASARGDSVRP